jgi:hypothetical protein
VRQNGLRKNEAEKQILFMMASVSRYALHRLVMPLQFLPSCIRNICPEITSLEGDLQSRLREYGGMKTPIKTTPPDPAPKPLQRKLGADHSDLAPKPRKHHSNFKQSSDLREDRGIRQIKSERKRAR